MLPRLAHVTLSQTADTRGNEISPLAPCLNWGQAMTYKLCASCGKHVRETDSTCWKCGSAEFSSTVTVGVQKPTTPSKPEQVTTRLWTGAKAAARGFSEEMERQREITKWGQPNEAFVCPHCQTKGLVHTMATTRKIGLGPMLERLHWTTGPTVA